MVSAKRGMGPSGWAPRRTHAVGTVTSRAGGIPSRALISSALRSFLGRRRGWPNEEANTLWVPTDARRGPGTAKKNEENMRRNNDEENCTFGIDRQTDSLGIKKPHASEQLYMSLVFACRIEQCN